MTEPIEPGLAPLNRIGTIGMIGATRRCDSATQLDPKSAVGKTLSLSILPYSIYRLIKQRGAGGDGRLGRNERRDRGGGRGLGQRNGQKFRYDGAIVEEDGGWGE
ncbi:hypothetical protein [Alicyclobacillus acidiphilus]|uniref:hypothetical protein n=1 Tax=Alicyclobacillus acidiphilus TaxID=182455 RepID=UPI000A3DF545|nr:hypothetical protein [Alicyclobacillus acidiphilus]